MVPWFGSERNNEFLNLKYRNPQFLFFDFVLYFKELKSGKIIRSDQVSVSLGIIGILSSHDNMPVMKQTFRYQKVMVVARVLLYHIRRNINNGPNSIRRDGNEDKTFK